MISSNEDKMECSCSSLHLQSAPLILVNLQNSLVTKPCVCIICDLTLLYCSAIKQNWMLLQIKIRKSVNQPQQLRWTSKLSRFFWLALAHLWEPQVFVQSSIVSSIQQSGLSVVQWFVSICIHQCIWLPPFLNPMQGCCPRATGTKVKPGHCAGLNQRAPVCVLLVPCCPYYCMRTLPQQKTKSCCV